MSKYVLNSNMTLSELSKKSNVPYSTIQEYLTGKKDINKCSMGTFKKIAHSLDMTMDLLYEALNKSNLGNDQVKYANIKIPVKFKGSFWDRTFDELDLDKEKDFIIIRLFMHGGFEGISFVENTFDEKDIIHALKTRRDLNPIVANYFQKKYKLNRTDMAYYTIVHDAGNDWR